MIYHFQMLQCYMVKNSLIKKPDKCKLKLTPPPKKKPPLQPTNF